MFSNHMSMNTDNDDPDSTEEDPLLINIRQVARQWYDQIVQEEEQHEYYFGDLGALGNNTADHSSTDATTSAYFNNQHQRAVNTTSNSNATPTHLLQDLRRILIQPHPTLPTNLTELANNNGSHMATDLRSGMILTLKYWYDMAVLRQSYHQRMAEQDVPYCSQQVRDWMKECAGGDADADDAATEAVPPEQLLKKPQHPVAPNQAPSPTDVKQLYSPLDTTTTTTATSNNTTTSSKQQQPLTTSTLSLERTHYLLATLYHGKKCRGGPTCTFVGSHSSCQRARALWSHVVACPNPLHHCPMPWCGHSRQVLQHYQTCTTTTTSKCPICEPVRQAMPKLQKTLGTGGTAAANTKKRLTRSSSRASEVAAGEGQVL